MQKKRYVKDKGKILKDDRGFWRRMYLTDWTTLNFLTCRFLRRKNLQVPEQRPNHQANLLKKNQVQTKIEKQKE